LVGRLHIVVVKVRCVCYGGQFLPGFGCGAVWWRGRLLAECRLGRYGPAWGWWRLCGPTCISGRLVLVAGWWVGTSACFVASTSTRPWFSGSRNPGPPTSSWLFVRGGRCPLVPTLYEQTFVLGRPGSRRLLESPVKPVAVKSAGFDRRPRIVVTEKRTTVFWWVGGLCQPGRSGGRPRWAGVGGAWLPASRGRLVGQVVPACTAVADTDEKKLAFVSA